jgi:dTDP-4-dehydrorhamnose reductase
LKKKIFISGISGFLGSNLYKIFKGKYEVYGGIYNKEFNLPNSKKLNMKLNSCKGITHLIKKINPRIIIHCAGWTDIEKCEKKKNNCKQANIELTKCLVKASKTINSKFIYISSDHLFDGKKKFYKENEKPNPLNYYAKTKVLSENYLRDQLKNYIIVRTNFFGVDNKMNKKNFLGTILKHIKQKKKLFLFDDVFYTPISINSLASIIIKLLKIDYRGIINISGNDRVSKYMFGKKVSKIFNLKDDMIKKISITKIKKLVKRPKDMSLSNKKLSYLGIKVKSLNSQLKELK